MSFKYNIKNIEEKWEKIFSQKGFFKPKKTSNKPFVIIMPPPNITGILHIGHAQFITLQDILVRFHRMKGFETVWIPGTDHAGIATQTVVERALAKENNNKYELGREKFTNFTKAWAENNKQTIINQMKKLGASADWSRQKFTLDDDISNAVNSAFLQLWNQDLIYRGERLVNWDPIAETAISDEEVEYKTHNAELYKFAYPVIGSSKEIIVATTRPETMLGDTAIAVHPNDTRYKNLIGKSVKHPFFPKRKIQIIENSSVDPTFGTGAVKITPAHDRTDFYIGEQHHLKSINILTKNAKINQNGGIYTSLHYLTARQKIKEDLHSLGFSRGETTIQNKIGVSSRSGAEIQPMLSRQYFIRTKLMAEKAYNSVNNGEIKIIPENWKKIFNHFILNIEDWCISRQLWWGHRIPIFYNLSELKKKKLDSLTDLEIRQISTVSTLNLEKMYGKDKYIQDSDVLDTWFSSALWPFSILGWPNTTLDMQRFYPSSVLETGSDILFFWVARMIMLGIHFLKQPPFLNIYLHSMVRDNQGRKMSKSLGNTINPIDVINGITLIDLIKKTKSYPVPEKSLTTIINGLKREYPNGIKSSGADGLRLTLAMLCTQNHDTKLSLPRVAGYSAFLNKFWNAAKYILNYVDMKQIQKITKKNLNLEDKYILSKLNRIIKIVDENLTNYEFSIAAEKFYHFFWIDVCDWYIELVKISKKTKTKSAVLLEILSKSTQLLHPFCPFITEEIWSYLPNNKTYCSFSKFPPLTEYIIDQECEKKFKQLQDLIVLIRNTRQESKIPLNQKISLVILATSSADLKFALKYNLIVKRLSSIESITFESHLKYIKQGPFVSNSNAIYEIILIPNKSIDSNKEKARLLLIAQKIELQLISLNARLINKQFLKNAHSEILKQHNEKLKNLETKYAIIKKNIADLT